MASTGQRPSQKPLAHLPGSLGVRLVVAATCALLLALPGCLKDIAPGLTSGEAGPRDFLSAADYTKWVVEIDAVDGQLAPGEAMATLRDRLTGAVNKQDGIEFRSSDNLAERGGTWTDKDLLQLSEANRDIETGGKTAVLHLLFVDGSYEREGVLGVTYTSKRNDGSVVSSGPIVIFSESIREACAPVVLVSPCIDINTYWAAVLVHEFGHALGLVDNGIAMQRNHEAETCDTGSGSRPDQGHSANSESVMHCAIETFDIANVFGGGGPPTTFDDDDKADMCAAGGKC